MKLNKIFAFALAALAFTACDDSSVVMDVDAPELNTNAGVTVALNNDAMSVAEDNGSKGRTFIVPMSVYGEANGAVKVTCKVEGYGENPATPFTYEDVNGQTVSSGNYILISDVVYLPADTSTSTFGLEITTVPDSEINDDRQLIVTIVDVQGGELGPNDNASTVVTLMDNDKELTWEWIGDAEFEDLILTGETYDVPCYIMEGPGVKLYKLEQPWASIGADSDFILDCSADEGVIIEEFDTGYYYASMGGNMILMSYSYYAASQGVSIDAFAAGYPQFNITLEDGVINFPESSMLCAFGTGTSLYYANDPMTIKLPTGVAKVKEARQPQGKRPVVRDFAKTSLKR